MNKLKVEYISKEKLKPYVNNAKIHTAEQVEQIKKSITEFGFNDPIAVWKDNEIIEGHGRLMAAMEMEDITEVPVIKLDSLTDEQRKAYTLVHNKITMNTDFDVEMLSLELEDIGMDLTDYGFEEMDEMFEDDDESMSMDRYIQSAKIPQYEPTGELPDYEDLVDTSKSESLIEEIEQADIDEETKEFLKIAAYRHNAFNYKNIAEFYTHQDKKVQELMEKSALVIIDINDAIANGYVKLTKTIQDIIDEEDDE